MDLLKAFECKTFKCRRVFECPLNASIGTTEYYHCAHILVCTLPMPSNSAYVRSLNATLQIKPFACLLHFLSEYLHRQIE